MRALALSLLFLAACASPRSNDSAGAAAATAASSMPSNAAPANPPASPPRPAQVTAPPPANAETRGPMTAAEAAQIAAREMRGGAGDASASEEGPCRSDDDCGLTRVAAGACCASLCEPRVVTKKRALELEQKSGACGKPCPQPLCRPPRMQTVPVCHAGKCVGRMQRGEQ